MKEKIVGIMEVSKCYRYFGEGLYLMEPKKFMKKTYSVVVAAVDEGWFISFVRTNLKFRRRMQ